MRNLFHSPQHRPPAEEYPVTEESQELGQFYEGESIPVHIASSEAKPSKRVAPEFGSCMAFQVAQIGVSAQPTQILPRRIHRYKALIFIRTTTACNVFINNNINALTNPTPQGWIAHAGANSNFAFTPEWDSQQPLYAISTVADTEIDIMDFSYGED